MVMVLTSTVYVCRPLLHQTKPMYIVMTISSSNVGNIDVDDEVSTVLRHFRPRPEFISSTAGKDHEWFKSGSSTSRHKQQKKYKKKRYDRGFTSVQYIAPSTTNLVGGKIRLTYLHNIIHNFLQNSNNNERGRSISIFLTFEIAVDTKTVTCVCCSAPNDNMSAELKVQMDTMCNELSTTKEGTTTDPSLFLVASRLLQLLNNEFPTTPLSNITIDKGEETFDTLVSRFVAKDNNTNKLKSKSTNAMYNMLDVQTLLLRCAAAGKNRSKVCAPVPVEFTSSVASGGSSDGDALSHRVFAASNQLYMHGFRAGLPQQQPMQQNENDTSDAGILLSFLLSLPWTGGSRLIQNVSSSSVNVANATTDKEQVNGNNNSKAKSSKSKVGRICIDIGTALGNPTPSFTEHASKYGTVQAFHGTKIESAWSIINHGLVNLSYHGSLTANGAMMGEGVYLSSSRQVAEYFAQSAAQQPGPALASAFQHESILHLLCVANLDISDLEPLECYDIICLPVFEATIIQPSSKSKNDTSGGVSDNGNRYTKQEGKYFVCTDSEFIRITKLHLTIELTKKTSIWQLVPRIPISMVVVLVAVFWMIR